MTQATVRQSPPARPARRGFTFIEVMFSVMILGFGVIMVAVMIPVAIRQTQETRETNAGNAVVESGFHNAETLWGSYDVVGQAPTLGGFLPSTNANPIAQIFVVSYPSWGWNEAWFDGGADADNDGFSDAQETAAGTLPNDNTSFPLPGLMEQSLGNRIDSMTAQTAWIPFYSREGTLAPFISLLGVQARNVQRFAPAHFTGPDNCPLPVVFEVDQLAPFKLALTDPASPKSDYESVLSVALDGSTVEHIEPTIIRIETAPLPAGAIPAQQVQQAAVEGAVLVVMNARGQIRILTLSKQRTDISLDHWELSPGGEIRAGRDPNNANEFIHEFELDTTAADEVPVRAWLVGRMLRNPAAPWDASDNPYIGKTQVIQLLEGKMLR